MLNEEQRIEEEEEEEMEVQGQMYDSYAHHDESSFDDNELRFHHDEGVEVDEYDNYDRVDQEYCTPSYDHDDVNGEHPHHYDYHLQHHENHIINDEEEIIMVIYTFFLIFYLTHCSFFFINGGDKFFISRCYTVSFFLDKRMIRKIFAREVSRSRRPTNFLNRCTV